MNHMYDKCEERTYDWARTRGILDQAKAEDQAKKYLEEVGETLLAIGANDKEKIKDGIGDSLVTLHILSVLLGESPLDCWSEVLDVIEKRQGKMINGQFVKDPE